MDIKKSFEICSAKANSPEAEQAFRNTCSLYERQCSAFNQSLTQDYQEYINHYHRITSLYLTIQENDKTKLIIYDTEIEIEEKIILDTPEPLNFGTCITQLPNGDLFCYGKGDPTSGITLIIDKNYEIRILPSGVPRWRSSGIFFNDNVYCFGGFRFDQYSLSLALASKFDFNENRWINLKPMPTSDCSCQIVILNRNILISSYIKKDLLLYSIDIDSYSTIPYNFAPLAIKILINAERLYLIESCQGGLIYESEDEYNWKIISNIIDNFYFLQAYYSYNKGGINISIQNRQGIYIYYKFDLNIKTIDKLKSPN